MLNHNELKEKELLTDGNTYEVLNTHASLYKGDTGLVL
jgi:hypothetical protein